MTVDEDYKNTVQKTFGDTALQIMLKMHNEGNPPVYEFKNWEEYRTELKVRSYAVKGIETTAEGCCSYPDAAHQGGSLDTTFWDKKGDLHFVAKSPLPAGKEASDAIEAIFKSGAQTFLDCYTMSEAVEYNSFLKALGKEKFNKLFLGGVGLVIKTLPESSLAAGLSIIISKGPISDTLGAQGKLDEIEISSAAQLIPGDRVYFKNFSDYLAKHPGGYWSGEHAFYNGNGKFSGFGVYDLGEEAMVDKLVEKYNEGLEEKDKKTKDVLKSEGGGLTKQIWRPVVGEVVKK